MFFTLTGTDNRHGESRFTTLGTLAVLTGLTFTGSPARAADPTGIPDGSSRAQERVPDVILARAILLAFDADPLLRDSNLLVSVVDGVAVVGGPVPSAEAIRRAGELVRGVRDVKEMRNKCFVQAGPDPLLLLMAGRVPPLPSRVSPIALPGVVTSPRPGAVPEDAVADSWENSVAAAEPAERSVVVRRPVSPADNVLLPPVGLSGKATTPVAPVVPPAVLTSVPPAPVAATVPGRPADALTAVEVVRRGDRRFAGLRVDLRDDTLIISGAAARSSDAWDFAQEIRRIPGVNRVAVGPVESR